MLLKCIPWGWWECFPSGPTVHLQQAGAEVGECLTSWPLSSNMMSSSARSSWQKSEHFSVTAK